VEAYHNRAVIHERRNDRDAAVRDYQTAVRYNPQYEPSRKALTRLKAPLPQAPKNASETQAMALADEAAGAARRGDYAAAAAKLDQAQALAPRLALIYQYRANVAYLKGDRAAAVEALRQGLKLEPDNALFRENLKRLEQPPSR
jgi:tetratricopeptide (TPR) repeat protein